MFADADSIIDFSLSRVPKLEVNIIFMDASCEIGGLDNGKNPMSEESLRIPTLMF